MSTPKRFCDCDVREIAYPKRIFAHFQRNRATPELSICFLFSVNSSNKTLRGWSHYTKQFSLASSISCRLTTITYFSFLNHKSPFSWWSEIYLSTVIMFSPSTASKSLFILQVVFIVLSATQSMAQLLQ